VLHRLFSPDLVLDDAGFKGAGRSVIRPLLRRPELRFVERIERGRDADRVLSKNPNALKIGQMTRVGPF
jgi:hypothetical protein